MIVQSYSPQIGNQSSLYYTQLIGDGSSTEYIIYHNLGDRNIMVQVYEESTGEKINVEIILIDSSSAKIITAVPVNINQYRVIIIK